MTSPFANPPVDLRDDLSVALDRAWARLGEPGSWLNGEQRLAVAAEARQAWHCDLCDQRKAALSPYAVMGAHDLSGAVPGAWVEVIHRVVTDSGRLSERWYRQALTDGVVEDELIEIISVAVLTTTVDAFALGIGMAPPALPEALPGEPARVHAPEAKPGPGWAATIAPADAPADFADFYANGSHFFIR
ncbi:MAG: alkylhydroperoxidase-related (seleno)protein, partial [Alphaproteobacteria bacterium]|nr:alkylhydroperoxidase-related (seleno)protein [Alphaproteobacteria bacterium]